MKAPMVAPVTPEQRHTLEREGWLAVPGLVTGRWLESLREAAVTLEQSARALAQDTVVLGVGYELQSASGRRGGPALEPGLLRKVTSPSKGHKAFAELRRDSRVLSLLEACGLPRATCHVDQLNFKPAGVGTGFPFHQDARFVIGKTQGRIAEHGGLNLVVALDRADASNGGFEVLGGTHLQGLLDLPYDAGAMNDGVFDESRRELVPLQPGDAVLFHPYLLHGSGPNKSTSQRRLVALWFVGG